MTVKRLLYDVEYSDSGVAGDAETREFRARVTMSDRLMAEARGRQYGLVDIQEQPQLGGALWIYFAALRERHIPADTEFADFQARCLDNTKVAEEDADPTKATASASPSSSVASSPASTGSLAPTTD